MKYLMIALITFSAYAHHQSTMALAASTPLPKLEVECKARLASPKGVMRGGWGNILYDYVNKGDKPVKMISWSGQWIVDGKVIRDWGWDKIIFDIPANGKITKSLTVWMPPNVADAVVKAPPVNKGFSTIVSEGLTNKIPFELIVPVAVITDPMEKVDGKNIALNLRKENMDSFKNEKEVIKFLDAVYLEMQDLTGTTPYNGDVIVLQESPPHHGWAHAGNPIMLNENHVKTSVKNMDNKIVSCGWVHEMGHDFDDQIGSWHIFSGQVAEFQANIKVGYALEKLITNGSFYVSYSWLKDKDGKFPEKLGRDYYTGAFVASGDRYLVDPSRTWESIDSNETQAFFIRLIRRFGWSPIKQWYRAYHQLNAKGFEKPATAAEKVELMCAVLSKTTDTDLVPIFQQWRFPVTEENVAAISKKYKLNDLKM